MTTLSAKLGQWRDWLEGKDQHSITNQIAAMLWRSAFYRSLNESRKYLRNDERGDRRASGALHELINEGYFTLHLSAIRRLVDQGEIDGARGVCSLYGLIRDIRDNCGLLTRCEMLAARNLAYEYEQAKFASQRAAWDEAQRNPGRGTFVSSDGWFESEVWHGLLDELCDVTPETRSRSDCPPRNRFDRMLRDLATCGDRLKRHVDKFIAHAATPESRNAASTDLSVSLNHLWQAERAVVRAASFISLYVIRGSNIGGVPCPQFDQFAYLDACVAEPSSVEAMKHMWRKHSDEIEACQYWFWNEPLDQ